MLSVTFARMQTNFLDQFPGPIPPAFSVTSVWMPPLFLALLVVLALIAISVPALRAWLRWRLPAFREASLAQLASAMSLMLRNGTTLVEALTMAQALESATPAGRTLAH